MNSFVTFFLNDSVGNKQGKSFPTFLCYKGPEIETLFQAMNISYFFFFAGNSMREVV